MPIADETIPSPEQLGKASDKSAERKIEPIQGELEGAQLAAAIFASANVAGKRPKFPSGPAVVWR